MAREKYLLKKINFGKKGEKSRELAEILLNKCGKTGFSKVVRNALVAFYSNDKEYSEFKTNMLLSKRKELKLKIPKISEELQINEKQLNKLGYKLKELE